MANTLTPIEKANRRIAWITTAVVASMLGMSFAAVPLYDLFCRTTGFGGTPMRVTEAARSVGEKPYVIRFDASVANGLSWKFEPEQTSITVKPGVVTTARYILSNTGSTEATGIASFNVLPEITGGYFNKLECFCYTEQTLKAGETREETVVFYLDPALEKDATMAHIDTLTLSYTFHAAKQPPKPLAANAASTQVR